MTALFQHVDFLAVYLMAAWELAVAVFRAAHGKPGWIDLGIFGFTAAICFVTFTGQCAEFARTAICVLPFFYLGCALNLQRAGALCKRIFVRGEKL